MSADALNTSYARTSADVLLTMQKNQVLVFFAVKRENFWNRHHFIANVYDEQMNI